MNLVTKRDESRDKYIRSFYGLEMEYKQMANQENELLSTVTELKTWVSGSIGNSTRGCITEALSAYNLYQQKLAQKRSEHEAKSEKAISQLASAIQVCVQLFTKMKLQRIFFKIEMERQFLHCWVKNVW